MPSARDVSRIVSVRPDSSGVHVTLRDRSGRDLELLLGPRQLRTLTGKLLTVMRGQAAKPPRRRRPETGRSEKALLQAELIASGGNVLRLSRRLGNREARCATDLRFMESSPSGTSCHLERIT